MSGNLYMNIGSIAVQRNEIDEAERMFSKAKDVFSNIVYPEGAAKLYANYGLLYVRKGNLSSAKDYFEKAIKGFLKLDNVEAARNVEGMLNILNRHGETPTSQQ